MKLSQAKQFVLPFVKKVKDASNVWTFYFKRPDKFDFFPGQYIRLTLSSVSGNSTESNREFTLSSSPSEKDFISFTTKAGKSYFKNVLFNLDQSQTVEIFGPMGGFYLQPEEIKTPRVFLAGGIGITPFRSMIKFASDINLQIPLTLISSFSMQEEMIFFKELKEIESNKSNIKIIYSISNQSQNLLQNGIEAGRISEAIIKKYIPNVHLVEFMVTGSTWMVDAIVDLLQKMGIAEEKIKVEQFTGY